MVDGYRLKLKIFLVIIFVLILGQLKTIFFWCNKLGINPTFIGIMALVGYIAIMIGYAKGKYWGYIVALIVFSVNLLYVYALMFFAFSQFSGSILVNLIINIPSLALPTFVWGALILYTISTKNFFTEPEPVESAFHQLMFVALIFAFLGILFIMFQASMNASLACDNYTFEGDERFATPENAIKTYLEGYHNRDYETVVEVSYFSESLKHRQRQGGYDFSQYLDDLKVQVMTTDNLHKIEVIDIPKQENVNANEVYIEYRIYFQKLEGVAKKPVSASAHLIKVNNQWKVNIERLFESQFQKAGV